MQNRPRILAVDDEKGFTDMIKQYFDLRGYDVDVADNGIEAVEKFANNKYDLVLLDLKMTGFNGDVAMKKMKAVFPALKAIIISAFSDSGKTRSRVMEEGAYAYIEKPISSLKDLEILVKKALDQA